MSEAYTIRFFIPEGDPDGVVRGCSLRTYCCSVMSLRIMERTGVAGQVQFAGIPRMPLQPR